MSTITIAVVVFVVAVFSAFGAGLGGAIYYSSRS